MNAIIVLLHNYFVAMFYYRNTLQTRKGLSENNSSHTERIGLMYV